MKGNFAKVADWVIEDEGGFVNDPDDPGKATNYGITIRTLSHYYNKQCTEQDVKDVTPELAKRIFYELYWVPAGCLDLPTGVDYVQLDAAIHAGVPRAVRFLQEALGTVEIDGLMGPNTVKACNKFVGSGGDLIGEALDERLEYLQSRLHAPKYIKGWENRLKRVNNRARRMLTNSPKKEQPRKNVVQSNTVKSTAIISAGQVTAAAGAFAYLDGYVQMALVGISGVCLVLSLVLFRKRLRAWIDGHR